jgi:hypothetical protein
MNYLKIIIIFLVTGSVIISCQTPQKISKSSFQGEINYDVSLVILDSTMTDMLKGHYSSRFGDSVNVTYDADGNIAMNYSGAKYEGFEYSLYSNSKNVLFAKFNDIDTVFSVDCAINRLNIIERRLDTSVVVILGRICDRLTIKAKDSVSNEVVIQEYYFNREIYLDSQKYNKFKNFLFSEFITESGSVYLKKVTNYGTFKVVFVATRINHLTSPNNIDLSIINKYPIYWAP